MADLKDVFGAFVEEEKYLIIYLVYVFSQFVQFAHKCLQKKQAACENIGGFFP